MALSEYSLRLQKGIVGGFAPPTPDAIYTITHPKDHADINIAGGERPTGMLSLQEFAPKSIPHLDAVTLIDELHSILKDLPTEQPPGSKDIYGLNTSIAWGSNDLEWFNGGPAGCGGGESSVKAMAQQKEKFKHAVEIVEHLVKKDK